MDTAEVTRRILAQRQHRFPDEVPGVGVAGRAPCRLDGRYLRVGFAAARGGAAPRLVAGVVEYAEARGYAVQWNVIPSRPGEEELTAALLGRGFEEEEGQRLMARAGPLGVAQRLRVTVAPIETWPAMVAYERGNRQAFFEDAFPTDGVVQRRAQERLREQQHGWCRYFAAYLDARQVGGCYCTLWEDVPTIMGVYTLAHARRQGVATTLLAYVAGALVAEGHAEYCLYVRHGNPAERLYRALGFVPLLDEHTYGRAMPFA